MSRLVRFGVAIDKDVLARFDRFMRKNRYKNRSEAIRDLMRKEFVLSDWKGSRAAVTGIVTVLYNHHKRGLVNKLLHIQHHHPCRILCAQHLHLRHDQCLEVIVAKGTSKNIKDLANALRVEKGVQFSSITPAVGLGLG